MAILLTRKEAAKELNISVATIDRLLVKGYFRPTRIGPARLQPIGHSGIPRRESWVANAIRSLTGVPEAAERFARTGNEPAVPLEERRARQPSKGLLSRPG